MLKKEVKIYPDSHHLAHVVAELIISTGNLAIQDTGKFSLVLAGGTTPKQIYQLMGDPLFSSRIDWSRVHIFWGDERCVPPDHPESNYLMAYKALLQHIQIPKAHVHRIRGELEPVEAAIRYQKTLVKTLGKTPKFDLILLGMGTDGHTASLFPVIPINVDNETLVAAIYVGKLKSWRVTLTPVVINQAHQVAFVVSGPSKAISLKEVLQGEYQPEKYPSQLIDPKSGTLTWFIDHSSAEYLNIKSDNQLT